MKMEEVKYYTIESYGWDCPKCGEYNEDSEDPSYLRMVACCKCGELFKPVSGD